MTENKEILKNLIWDSADNFLVDEESDGNKDSLSSATRIVHLRYRFYAVWIFLCILLVIYRLILPSIDNLNAEKDNLENAKLNLINIESRETAYENNKWLLDDINDYESKIVSCLNVEEGCLELPTDIQDDFAVVRSYLLTHNLNDEKMDTDERKIIENIDTMLLKSDFMSEYSDLNGIISKISIWDKTLQDDLYVVPVQLNITFENRESLLSFINNVERYIPEEETMRILYKIDRITYDIVNSDEPQDTVVYMNLYYYEE